MVDLCHLDLCQHHVAGAHGGEEFQALAQIDSAVPGQLFPDHRRHKTRCQHPMRDAPAKDRVLRIILIQMDGVPVGGDIREHLDIPVGDHLAQGPHHADFDIFDADRAARCIVQHWSLQGVTKNP